MNLFDGAPPPQPDPPALTREDVLLHQRNVLSQRCLDLEVDLMMAQRALVDLQRRSAAENDATAIG